MIHPNMATMLVFLTTDCAISPAMLQAALCRRRAGYVQHGQRRRRHLHQRHGRHPGKRPRRQCRDHRAQAQTSRPSCRALNSVTVWLCRQIAGDGEGATQACSSAASPALKATAPPRPWPRASSARRSSRPPCSAQTPTGAACCAPSATAARMWTCTRSTCAFRSAAGTVSVCVDGAGIPFSEEKAKKVLLEQEIEILVDLKSRRRGRDRLGLRPDV